MSTRIPYVLFLCVVFSFSTKALASKVHYAPITEIEIKKNDNTSLAKDSLQKDITATKKKIEKQNSAKTFREFTSLQQFDTPVIEKSTLDFKAGYQFIGENADQDKKWLEQAKNVFKVLEKTKNYIDELTTQGLKELPVAIRPVTISNVTYTVGIAKAVFKPTYTELTVFLKVELPESNTTGTSNSEGTAAAKKQDNVLILGASNIKLSRKGGIMGDARLNLISQFSTNINNGAILFTLKGSFEKPGTYAKIDCFGFKEFGLDANIKFTDGLLFPVDEHGKKKIGYLESDFKIVASDWNDIVANISLPEFGINGVEGTTFRLNTAVFDFSDLRNDDAIPEVYLEKYYKENPTLWRGVYINTLEIVLPKAFKKKNSDNRIAFGATDLIIDGQGVTGKFTGKNVITIEEGSASGWGFSLEYFLLDIEVNKLKAGKFRGEIILPVSELDKLKYSALIQPDEYSLSVQNTKELSFDVWNAEVSLTKESYVELKIKDDKFRPKASLNGNLSIKSGLKKDSNGTNEDTVNFKGIVFQEMVLQTESPKFSAAYFGYQGKMSVAKFPITVNEIAIRTPSGGQSELVFDFNINLTSESDGGNGGGAKLAIKAKLETQQGRDRWKYDGIRLERVFIEMEVAGMELKGAIFIFEDDPAYGTGFAGAVGAKFTVGMKLEVEAKALFGRTKDFRYWFADAQVTLPTGIPVFTAFSVNSFGGGCYNHMKMAGVTNQNDAAYNQIGASLSGVVYEPFQENGFGLKASVGLITTGSEELFHGTLEFGISFLNSGGLQEVYFKGEGEMITSMPGDFYDKLQDKLALISKGNNPILPPYQPEGAMAANVFIKYDFVNNIFHATSELYINFGILKGVGANGRAGWLDFYVGPDDWHILVGTPSDPVGVKLDIGILKMKTESYFMMGDNLPGSPPPPHFVANILGIDASKLDYTRDLNMLKSGKGLAFGSHFSMTTGDLRFLIFYARFDAGLGFDVMLKDYGEAHCKGSSEPIGLNGWYANGQAYAYLQGEVGLKIRLFGIKKKITIFSGGGALIMQARLPNPVWFRGYLGGRYNLLGGLVKGRFRFKVELGDKCEIIGGSVIDGIVVIGEMSPKEGSTEVDVFAAPQVPFNLEINKVFELPDDTGDRKYRILMDKFEVTKNGQPIKGEIEWNRNNDEAVFYSHEILPPRTSLKAFVQLHFEEYINGKWETIKSDGKVSIETKEVNFTTGVAPETIPLNNIAFMYPVIHQKNFFINEYNKGYINLKRGQSYLFNTVTNWDKTMVMSSTLGEHLIEDFTYSSDKRQIVYNIPADISIQTSYNVKIRLVPKSIDNSENIKDSYSTKIIDTENSGNELEIKSRKAEDVIIKAEERELLTFDFKTSQYTTFDNKMRALKGNKDLYEHVTYPYGLTLLSSIDPLEPFDLVELIGNQYSGNKPIIVARAILDNTYYKTQIYPLLYENYPLEGKFSVSRETDKVRVPPIEGVEPMSWYITYLENNYTGETSLYNPYRYNLTHYYHRDYEDLRYQLVSSDLPFETIYKHKNLVIDPFPLMRKGKYKVKFQYVLPGQLRNGGTDIIKFTNPLYE